VVVPAEGIWYQTVMAARDEEQNTAGRISHDGSPSSLGDVVGRSARPKQRHEAAEKAHTTRSCWADCTVLRVVAMTAMVLFLCGGTLSVSVPVVRHGMLQFFAWAQSHITLAASIYVAIFTVGAVICLPEIVLAASAGYLFGFPIAFACTYGGGLLAAMIAFTISRFFLRGWVVRKLVHKSKWLAEIDKALRRKGFALALLIRLPCTCNRFVYERAYSSPDAVPSCCPPDVPFVQMNYVFGVTPLSIKHYFVATAVGIIPGSALYVRVPGSS